MGHTFSRITGPVVFEKVFQNQQDLLFLKFSLNLAKFQPIQASSRWPYPALLQNEQV
jgi:hypothetical protein